MQHQRKFRLLKDTAHLEQFVLLPLSGHCQDDLLMVEKGDLGDFSCGMVVVVGYACISSLHAVNLK